MKHWQYPSTLLVGLAISAAFPATTAAQDSGGDSGPQGIVLEEVVVTARRREEFLQDVPASMTVFNQSQLDDANIVNSADLATYTPSLQSNTRFGGDNATFAIRGFSQELRTTASVGVYFAEVVAPRGANSQQSGDGAGPGDFFDLTNVQVLKGPTGTLFGRNTTGGAIILTPARPTGELEGYGEIGAGNYDMWRSQGVLNVPVTDNFKLRFGIDHQERDGYLNNISGIGPEDFANVDYTASRLSALWNITDSLENYTIARYTHSDNNGYPSTLFYCNPEAPLGAIFCQPDLDERIANGDNDFWDVYSFVSKPVNEQKLGQVINTTTWELSDDLLIKNILSYATLETRQRSAIYGTNWEFLGQPIIFQQVGLARGQKTTDQETWVEEIQIQGTSLDDSLTWQAGLYYEKSEPKGDYGAQSPALMGCLQETITSNNPEDFRCNNILGAGALQYVPGGVTYTNQAIYAQATYDFNYDFSLTAGLRYTKDETEGYTNETIYYFAPNAPGQYGPPVDILRETRTPETESDEPTWLLGLDYRGIEDVLLYGKYSRGYRQGSVNIGGSTGLDVHGPETVDTYEIGFKSSFRGAMPGTLNMAAFYNDFSDQQIQFGYFKPTNVGTTAIVNAGESTIWGVEIEGNVLLTSNFMLNASYAYLDTEVKKIDFPPIPPGTIASGNDPNVTTTEGEPLSYAPENQLVLTATYQLPFSADVGEIKLSASYIYTDEMQAVSEETSIYATLPDYELVNLNFNWNGVFGTPVDISAFVTNLTDEEQITFLTGNWQQGLETGQVNQPRFYGARVRYNF